MLMGGVKCGGDQPRFHISGLYEVLRNVLSPSQVGTPASGARHGIDQEAKTISRVH